jgi:hypothetical protein
MHALNALAAGDLDGSVIALAMLVISGSGRGAGKTAVGCALMAAIPELRWAAVKVTPHLHDETPGVWEERDAGSEKDTGRYLAAGARRAFLMTAASALSAEELMLETRKRTAECYAWLIESNRDLGERVSDGERVVRLAVMAGAPEGWKASLREAAARADGLVLTGGLRLEDLPSEWRVKAAFSLQAGEWMTLELVAFVRSLFAGR